MTTFLEQYRPIFIAVTFGFLGAAFYLTYRPRRGAANESEQRTPTSKLMAANKVMLWAVTVVAVVFLFFPQAVSGLFASGDEFTADMQRTVIQIEGMT